MKKFGQMRKSEDLSNSKNKKQTSIFTLNKKNNKNEVKFTGIYRRKEEIETVSAKVKPPQEDNIYEDIHVETDSSESVEMEPTVMFNSNSNQSSPEKKPKINFKLPSYKNEDDDDDEDEEDFDDIEDDQQNNIYNNAKVSNEEDAEQTEEPKQDEVKDEQNSNKTQYNTVVQFKPLSEKNKDKRHNSLESKASTSETDSSEKKKSSFASKLKKFDKIVSEQNENSGANRPRSKSVFAGLFSKSSGTTKSVKIEKPAKPVIYKYILFISFFSLDVYCF